MRTYIDARTNALKPLHTDYGAVIPTVGAETWLVSTQGQLMDALKGAQDGGGIIRLQDVITVAETVSVPSGTKITGGGIRAADGFKRDGHLMHIRNGAQDVWLDGVELDANGQQVRTLPIMESAKNILLARCLFRGGQVGVTISGGASNISVLYCTSRDHHRWHGFAVQHTDCTSILFAGCSGYRNAAYGLDSHGTRVEVGGCEFFENGQNKGSYEGGCTKFPEAAYHYIHDNALENDDSGGYGCIWTYGDPAKGQRRPKDVFVYRNDLVGDPHYRTGPGATLTQWDNTTMRLVDGALKSVAPIEAGTGQVVAQPDLGNLPDEPDDKAAPIDPPETPEPEQGLTELQREQVRAIAQDELSKLRVWLSYE